MAKAKKGAEKVEARYKEKEDKGKSRSKGNAAKILEGKAPQKKATKVEKRFPTKEALKKEQEARFRIAQKFAARLIEKFKRTVKSVVVYGSTAKGTAKKESDLDIFVILDDTKVEKEIPADIKDRIWNELLNIAKDTDERISIQAFMFITEFWESLRVAEPVTLAILRYGIPIFDVGVFMPAKRMLERGNIPTTKEAIDKKIIAAPQFVEYAQSRVKSAGHYLEQAMASAGNAALMFIGRLPQNKEDVPKELAEYFVKEGLLEQKYVDDANAIIVFAKKLEHDKEEMPNAGAETDKHVKMADDFVKRMQVLLKELEMRRKTSILMKTYKTFLKADVGALRYAGIKPPEELKDLPKTFYENFPELKELHAELFETLTKALSLIKEGKGEQVPEREVYLMRERTKEFVIRLGDILKRMKDEGKLKPLPPEEEAKAEAEVKESATGTPDILPEDHAVEKLETESKPEKKN